MSILLKYLSSVKLTIALLVLIVIASVIGTIISQNVKNEKLIALQLNDVYHSYWYMVLLVLFCVNLCVCSIRNFMPLLLSLHSLEDKPVELSALALYEKIGSDSRIDGDRIKRVFVRNFYKFRQIDTDLWYFERGKLSRLGPMITHASIIIILTGGMFVARMGFKEDEKIPVGDTINVLNFQVKAENFKVEFYPDSKTPKEYTSILTIIENGAPVVTGIVEVNHPMKYKGIRFYQSEYGLVNTVEIELSKDVPGKPEGKILGKFRVNDAKIFDVPDSRLKIKMLVYVPDFVIDDSGNIATRSMEPGNPAALFEIYEGDNLKYRSWKFLKFPDFSSSAKSDYSIKILSIEPAKFYTQLQISRDPGLSVIWIGSLLMIVGLFFSFYLSHKKVWVKLSNENTILEIGGKSYKNRGGFDKEFRWLHDLTDK